MEEQSDSDNFTSNSKQEEVNNEDDNSKTSKLNSTPPSERKFKKRHAALLVEMSFLSFSVSFLLLHFRVILGRSRLLIQF